jgi:hypothetical protein
MSETQSVSAELMTTGGAEKGLARPNVQPVGAEPEPNYQSGFEGMAVSPFSQAAIAVLRRPIDPDDVEIKPDGIVFLPGVVYRQRLDEAFGPGAWAMPPRGPARRLPKSGGELVMFNGVLVILGRFVAERIGQCMYYPNNAGMTYADAYEGAITDCLGRCCKDIFVAASVLWNKGWRDQWLRKYAEQFENPRNGKMEWRRKASLRKNYQFQSVAPPTEGAPFVSSAASAPPAVPGGPPSVQSAPPAPESRQTELVDNPATDATLDLLEKTAFEELKWPHDFAGRWLFNKYQTRNPSDLTEAKAREAIETMKTEGPVK